MGLSSVILDLPSTDWRPRLFYSVKDAVPGVMGVVLLIFIPLVPVEAQAISDRRDQPTQADIPQGTRPPTDIAPPQAIKPATKVMPGNTGLTNTKGSRTNPLDYLSKRNQTLGERRPHRR